MVVIRNMDARRVKEGGCEGLLIAANLFGNERGFKRLTIGR